MQPTWASCRPSEPARRRGAVSAGFTLLELLLVLTLVALLTGLVAPRAWQWIDSARLRANLDRARTSLESLPRQAFATARRIEVNGEAADLPLTLPDGWSLVTPAPLRYGSNGMTAGGRLRVMDEGRVVADWVVEAPAGAVRAAGSHDGPFPAAVER